MAILFSDCDVIQVVFTKPKEKDGVMKYHVDRRVRFIALFPTLAPRLTPFTSLFPLIC